MKLPPPGPLDRRAWLLAVLLAAGAGLLGASIVFGPTTAVAAEMCASYHFSEGDPVLDASLSLDSVVVKSSGSVAPAAVADEWSDTAYFRLDEFSGQVTFSGDLVDFVLQEAP